MFNESDLFLFVNPRTLGGDVGDVVAGAKKFLPSAEDPYEQKLLQLFIDSVPHIRHGRTGPGSTYNSRRKHLLAGSGLNGPIALNAVTIVDDAMADILFGEAGTDWFLAALASKDKVRDKAPGEVFSRI